MRYTIVKHDSLEQLVAHVNALISEGWCVVGGCAAIAVPEQLASGDTEIVRSERHYAQAMLHPSMPPSLRPTGDCPVCAGTGQIAPAG